MKQRNIQHILAIVIVAAFTYPCIAQGVVDSGKQEIIQQMQDNNREIYQVTIAKDLVHLQMPSAWWAKMTASDKKGVEAVEYVSRGISEYANLHGMGNAADFEDSLSSDTADEKKSRIQKMIDDWKGKVSVTFKVEPQSCDSSSFDLAMRYLTTVGEVLETKDLLPASANVTFVASGTAKDISVTTADGRNFVATGPVNHEPLDWGTKITTGFERLSKNRVR